MKKKRDMIASNLKMKWKVKAVYIGFIVLGENYNCKLANYPKC